MTGAAFRKLALAMPGATEAPHFDRISFRAPKIFATMTKDAQHAMVRVQPVSRCYALIREQPTLFFSYGGFTERFGSLGVHLPAIDATTLTPMLQASYDSAIAKPKKKRRS